MLNEPTTTGIEFTAYPALQPVSQKQANTARYAHILVPTSLTPGDLPALQLGLDLAALHRAALTVLHVAPPPDDAHAVHWLHAIERLHRGLDRTGAASLSHDGGKFADSPRSQIIRFIEREISEPLHDRVAIRTECRTGDVADVIARFANNSQVDLLVLSIGRSAGWWPFLPARVRRMMQLTRSQIILIGPGARPHNGLSLGSLGS